ncbi:MAG TPA: hypothetical protein VJV78_48430 [Polyangiales bacterium]|nr:hypothetical protein [Polyangiales bacterium]
MLSAAVGLAIAGLGCDAQSAADLEHALVGRGRIAVLGGEDLVRRQAHGSELGPVSRWPELDRALAGSDERALAQAMQTANVQGILVDARRDALPERYKLGAQLARYARSQVLQGAYLSPRAALYVLDPVRDWSPSLRAGMAEVARRLVGGALPPRLRSFPEATRRMEPAEVMVLLRSGSRARLWRSARGSSFARALLTAAEVARQRWMEREQAMGGKLDKLLPKLQVEVSLLQDDGELGARDAGFVDRVVFAQHGVAYEHKGAWRYLLPEATHTSSPSHAYARLFAEDGLPEDSLTSREVRPYRMAVKLIGISAPQSEDGLSEVHSPEEVLGRGKP